MDRAEFERLAEIYGGDLNRWPEAMRSEAFALAARDAGARAALTAASALDAGLEAALTPPPPSPAMAEAMTASFAQVAVERAREPARARSTIAASGGLGAAFRRVARVFGEAAEAIGGRGAFAGGLGAAAAAGLAIGALGFDAAAEGEPAAVGVYAASGGDEVFDVVNVEVWFINDEI